MVGLVLLDKVTIIEDDVIIFNPFHRSVSCNIFELPSFLTVNRLISAYFSHILVAELALSSLFSLAREEPIFQVDIIISSRHHLYPGLFIVIINVLLQLHQSHIVNIALVLVQISIPIHFWHNVVHLIIICIRLKHKCTVFVSLYLN